MFVGACSYGYVLGAANSITHTTCKRKVGIEKCGMFSLCANLVERLEVRSNVGSNPARRSRTRKLYTRSHSRVVTSCRETFTEPDWVIPVKRGDDKNSLRIALAAKIFFSEHFA